MCEYRDAPKIYQLVSSLCLRNCSVRAGKFLTAVMSSLLATDTQLEAEARVRKVEEEPKLEKDIGMSTVCQHQTGWRRWGRKGPFSRARFFCGSPEVFVCICLYVHVSIYVGIVWYILPPMALLTGKRATFNWLKGIKHLYKLRIGYSKIFRNQSKCFSGSSDFGKCLTVKLV